MQDKVPSSKKPIEKEYEPPRVNGGGDGVPQNTPTKQRVPASSAKKFNARTPRDESLKLKLKSALVGVCSEKKPGPTKTWTPNKHQLLKSASVAEITPTKAKRRLSLVSTDSLEIYATPRPLNDETRKKFCVQERNTCRIYRRVMLLAWRRTRDTAKTLNALVRKQEMQLAQLEMQVDVLNKLRISESEKRVDTQAECQSLKKTTEILELENSQLTEETQNLNHTLDILQNDLKVAKAENNFLSDQFTKLQDTITKQKFEKRSLEEKLRLHEEEISSQKTLISNLETNLKSAEKELKTAEINYRIKEKKYAQLKCKFKNQLDTNNSVTKQLQVIEQEKIDISFKVEDLESQINDYINSCEILKDVNAELEQEMLDMSVELEEEKKRTWLTNTKQFALLSLSALQKIAHKGVQAYLDGSANF